MRNNRPTTFMAAQRVRYHEAGHAVVARVLGIDVAYVTARSEGKYRGLTRLNNDRREQKAIEFLDCQIKILLAGSYAELKRYPDFSLECVIGDRFDDWSRAYGCADRLVQIRRLPRPERMDILRQYPASTLIIERSAAETKQLLTNHWPAVVRVAKALHHNARIKQPALDDLIAGRPIRVDAPISAAIARRTTSTQFNCARKAQFKAQRAIPKAAS